MKKIFIILMMICSMGITSCVTTTSAVTAQEISYYDDYVYSGVTYPVLYINSVPHYFYGERWIVVPTANYHCLRHYHHPMTFRGTPPQNWVQPHRHDYYKPRPQQYGHDRYHGTTTKPNGYKPSIQHRPNTQPTRPNPNTRPGGYTNYRNHGNSQRPTNRGGATSSRGGRK